MIEPGGSLYDQYGPGSLSDRPGIIGPTTPGSLSDGRLGGGGSPAARPGTPAPPYQKTSASPQPIPIAYGRVKLPFIILEKDAPTQVAAPAWTASTAYTAGQIVVSLEPVGASYECTRTGTSGSTQPSGKGENISDGGGCLWKYIQDGIAQVYLQRFVAGLCEGSVSAVHRVWQDKTYWNQADAQQQRALVLGPGDATNEAVLTAGGHLRYPYTACLCAPTWPGGAAPWFTTGSQRELPSYGAEVQAAQCGDTSTADVNPALIINDLLTNARFGGRWDPSWFTLDAPGVAGSYRTWCDAFGFRISVVLDGETSLLDAIQRVLAATNAEWRMSGATLTILPLGDTASTSPVYGATNYTPSNTAVADILASADLLEPLDVEIKRDADRFNVCPVSWTDRAAGYVERVDQAPDISDVLKPGRGEWRAPTQSLGVIFPEASKAPLMLSRIWAQRSLYCTRTFTLKLSLRFCRLEGGDIITITDDLLGLDHIPARIISVEEVVGDDGRISITVVAEDWPTGVASAQGFTPQSQDGIAQQVSSTASAVATPAAASQAQTQALIGQTAAAGSQLVGNGSGEHGLEGWTGLSSAGYAAGLWGTPAEFYLYGTSRDANYGPWFRVKQGDEFYASFVSIPYGGGTGDCDTRLGLHLRVANPASASGEWWVAACTRLAAVGGQVSSEGSVTVPAGYQWARVWLQQDHAGGTPGAGYFYKAIMVRRKVDRQIIHVDALATSNYAEDGSGIPTAGAKLDHEGQALKAAPGSVQIGIACTVESGSAAPNFVNKGGFASASIETSADGFRVLRLDFAYSFSRPYQVVATIWNDDGQAHPNNYSLALKTETALAGRCRLQLVSGTTRLHFDDAGYNRIWAVTVVAFW